MFIICPIFLYGHKYGCIWWSEYTDTLYTTAGQLFGTNYSASASASASASVNTLFGRIFGIRLTPVSVDHYPLPDRWLSGQLLLRLYNITNYGCNWPVYTLEGAYKPIIGIYHFMTLPVMLRLFIRKCDLILLSFLKAGPIIIHAKPLF